MKIVRNLKMDINAQLWERRSTNISSTSTRIKSRPFIFNLKLPYAYFLIKIQCFCDPCARNNNLRQFQYQIEEGWEITICHLNLLVFIF